MLSARRTGDGEPAPATFAAATAASATDAMSFEDVAASLAEAARRAATFLRTAVTSSSAGHCLRSACSPSWLDRGGRTLLLSRRKPGPAERWHSHEIAGRGSKKVGETGLEWS